MVPGREIHISSLLFALLHKIGFEEIKIADVGGFCHHLFRPNSEVPHAGQQRVDRSDVLFDCGRR